LDGRRREAATSPARFTTSSKRPGGLFLEMAEDGMTFMGAMECIFADEKPTDYDLGATKGWLPKSKEFDDWIGYSPGMSQLVIAVYLIYGGSEDE